MRVLVACEFSGTVRRAFRALGHDAWSCDLLPAEDGDEHHYQRNVLTLIGEGWDLMVAHPPCTHLATSGARWFPGKVKEQEEALAFVRKLLDAPIPRIALENPRSVISTRIRSKDQVIRPYQFGEREVRQSWFWLKGLPKLHPTEELTVPEYGSVEWKRWNRIHRHHAPGPNRWKERSRTLPGIAKAMAAQWGLERAAA
jgi:hypothetical protein